MSNPDVLAELRGFCHGKSETVYTRAVAEIERLRDEVERMKVTCDVLGKIASEAQEVLDREAFYAFEIACSQRGRIETPK